MTNSQYRAVIGLRGKSLADRLELPIRDSLNIAICDASSYLPLLKTRSVTVLKADTTGINAGKFFLHQILK